ncbi:hypothetical protein C8F04DRAFT_1188924 [Mycena alexandri]|uniref:Uncharacterized protein n=1 Tax=Mycena alexandri TaxID=1745969 RepID=A0AAD6SL43_9AGAR|nr:hypothetical protein C8F04DRAFT_1188924 [Mycena alexandri]
MRPRGARAAAEGGAGERRQRAARYGSGKGGRRCGDVYGVLVAAAPRGARDGGGRGAAKSGGVRRATAAGRAGDVGGTCMGSWWRQVCRRFSTGSAAGRARRRGAGAAKSGGGRGATAAGRAEDVGGTYGVLGGGRCAANPVLGALRGARDSGGGGGGKKRRCVACYGSRKGGWGHNRHSQASVAAGKGYRRQEAAQQEPGSAAGGIWPEGSAPIAAGLNGQEGGAGGRRAAFISGREAVCSRIKRRGGWRWMRTMLFAPPPSKSASEHINDAAECAPRPAPQKRVKPSAGPEAGPQWLLWGCIKEFGMVTSMFKPAIPLSSTPYWVGKKWNIILKGLKIAPAELYITFLLKIPENAWMLRGRGKPRKAKVTRVKKGHCEAVSKDIQRQNQKGQALVRRVTF